MNEPRKMDSMLFFPKISRRAAYKMTRHNKYYQDYNTYKQEIREDCLGRCVYCDCHENHIGGHQSMNLDHLRPKGLPEFKHLIHDPNNLVWSCGRCNRLKLDHWPAQGTDSTFLGEHGFIDPFGENRLEYFSVQEDGSLLPLKPPAHYMIELLGLNYHIARQLREMRLLAFKFLEMVDEEMAYLKNKPELSSDDIRILQVLQASKLIHERVLDFTLYP